MVELEEQLRVDTFQRKKAENAMTEVLISLEKNGFTYFSEAIHSGSDNNGLDAESKMSINSGREFCTTLDRNLYQKSCKSCLNQNGKTHDGRGRRRTSSTSSGGSTTPDALGKSICQTEGENRFALECHLFLLFYRNDEETNMSQFMSLVCM